MRARTVIGAGIAVLAVAGIAFVALRSKPSLPEEGPSVVVVVQHRAPAAELETTIAQPIEEAVSGLPLIERVRTESGGGAVRVTCRFQKVASPDTIAEQTQTAIDGVLKKLPPEVSPPIVQRPPARSVLYYAYDKTLPELERIPGVADAVMCGARKDRVHVVFDFRLANERKVDITDVFAAFTTRPDVKRDADAQMIASTPLGTSGAVVKDVAAVTVRKDEPPCIGVLGGKPDLLVGRIRLQPGKSESKATIAIGAVLRKASGVFFDAESTVRLSIGLPNEKVERRVAADALAAALKKVPGVYDAAVFAGPDERDGEAVVSLTPNAKKEDVDAVRAAVKATLHVSDHGLVAGPVDPPPRVAVLADDEATANAARSAVDAPTRRLVRDLMLTTPHIDVKVDKKRTFAAGQALGEVARTAQIVLEGVDTPLFHLETAPSGREGIEMAKHRGYPLAQLLSLEASDEATLLRIDRKRVFERVWEVEDTGAAKTIRTALEGKPARVELLPAP